MPFVPAANVALIEFLMTLDNQAIENVYHARFDGSIGVGDLSALWVGMLGWWQDSYAPELSESLVLRAIKITDLTTATSAAYEAAAPAGTNGDVVQPPIQNRLAFVVKHTTYTRGRSSRGRTYVPGIPVTSVGGNYINSTKANNLVDAFVALDAVLNAGVWVPVVLSTRTGGADRTSALSTIIQAHSYTDLVLDGQRRRTPGVGG